MVHLRMPGALESKRLGEAKESGGCLFGMFKEGLSNRVKKTIPS